MFLDRGKSRNRAFIKVVKIEFDNLQFYRFLFFFFSSSSVRVFCYQENVKKRESNRFKFHYKADDIRRSVTRDEQS